MSCFSHIGVLILFDWFKFAGTMIDAAHFGRYLSQFYVFKYRVVFLEGFIYFLEREGFLLFH